MGSSVPRRLIAVSSYLARSLRVRGKKPNFYAGMIAEGSSGKGMCARALMSCLLADRMDFIGNSSEKTMMKTLCKNPWGAGIVNEFQQYLVPGSWQSNVIQIGRASCRERVSISVVAVSLKKI